LQENKIRKGYSDYPKGMDFLLTYDCNLKCKYCPWWKMKDIKNFRNIYMDTSSAIKLIDEISSFKPFIRLFGGEPFLHPEWFEIVRYAKEKGIFCTSVTNGTFLYDQAEKFIKSGILSIGVSWDGFESEERGIGLSKKIIEGINEINKLKNFYKSEDPIIEIYLTINEKNYRYLFEFGNYLKDFKISLYRLQHLIWFSKKQYYETLKILKKNFYFQNFFGPEEGYIKEKPYNFNLSILKEQIKKLKEGNFKFKVEFHPSIDFSEMDGFYNDLEYKRDKPCKTMEIFCYISPEGILFPCFTLNLGNVFEKGFLKLWNSKKIRRFRKLVRGIGRFPICARCPD
jgi:MoaA/NifB/PqqE/SkfB family radical SAM enzyme